MFKSKKGQASRTLILFGVLIFYCVMFVFYTAYGSTVNQLQSTNTNQPNYISQDYTGSVNTGNGTSMYSTGQEKSGLSQITKYVVTGFKESPTWLNIIVFLPLGILVGYLILVAFTPTINAGG